MSEHVVDLGAIRGDWDFHARYVTNSMEQTLKRLQKYWRALKRRAPAAGIVPMEGELVDEFIEACRQTRALCDDLLLMRETKTAKKGGRRATKRPGKRKARGSKK
jgi:hypothetical protein